MANSFKQRQSFLKKHFGISLAIDQSIIALAGNPNVGKSTIFNTLTGLHQHTGNWPGKTVDYAQGTFTHHNQDFLIIDLPGTYSLLAHSAEEEITRRFLCCGEPDATLVVVDASCLERNLNLALQVTELTGKVIICVNLLDEATQQGIHININALSREFGVPVIGTTARTGKGIAALKEALFSVTNGIIIPRPRPIAYSSPIEAALEKIIPLLEPLALSRQKNRWIALRLLADETEILSSIATEELKWLKK